MIYATVGEQARFLTFSTSECSAEKILLVSEADFAVFVSLYRVGMEPNDSAKPGERPGEDGDGDEGASLLLNLGTSQVCTRRHRARLPRPLRPPRLCQYTRPCAGPRLSLLAVGVRSG